MKHAVLVMNKRFMRPLHQGLLLSLSAFVLSCVCFSPASATPLTPIDVPASTSAGQIEKRFEQSQTQDLSPNLQLALPTESEIASDVQEKLAGQKFLLKEIVIDNMSVYKTSDISFAYENLIGKTVSLLDVRSITKEISKKYHNEGYILTQAVVPPQDITDGTIHIRIVEGFVGNISIQGDQLSEAEREQINEFSEQIKSKNPVTMEDLERYLLLINDLPGVSVSGLLRPQPASVGATELVLNLSQKSFEGSYTMDNRGSKFIGPWQHTTSLTANSLFGLYDRTQVRTFYANPVKDELMGFEIQHEEQIGNEGTKLTFLVSQVHTHPQGSLEPLDINGTSNLFEAKVTHPFIRLRKETLLGRFVLDYRDTTTDLFSTTSYTKDRLRIARAGGTYNIIDGARGNDTIDLQISQGMDIFAATDHGAERSNAVGDSSFTKANFDLTRIQPLPENFSLLTGITGQYSLDPLLADEQFGIGGSEYGRAFDSSDSMGDCGVAAKAELRYNDKVSEPYLDSYQLYTFYDAGRTWYRDAEPGANTKTIRSSTGAGVRLTLTENLLSNFEAAIPLVEPSNSSTDYRHDPRFFMSFTARF